MKLHHQLLLVSLLLLGLPWAGCQTVREMEGALRAGQAQSLAATASAVAAVLATAPDRLYPQPERLEENSNPASQVVFFPAPEPVVLDGYDNEWAAVPARELQSGDGHFRWQYRAVNDKGRLAIFVTVHDDTLRYENPARTFAPNGDRLVLVNGEGRHLVLATSAPGMVYAREQDGRQWRQSADVRAQWQDTADGYQVELVFPERWMAGRLGLYVVNESNEAGPAQAVGTVAPDDANLPPWAIVEPPGLAAQLAVFQRAGLRLQVLDRFGWQLAEAGSVASEPASDTPWLLRQLYRAILAKRSSSLPTEPIPGRLTRTEVTEALAGHRSGQWYASDDPQARQLLSVAVPVTVNGRVLGAVLAGQSSEPYLSLTDSAFSRVLVTSFGLMVVIGLGLLGYASWLSWRIRRLSRAAEGVLGQKGEWQGDFPQSRAGDEVGDLARSYGTLLGRLKEYTEYLRTLSRKLSHELRTPIAVVQSSLDNLGQHPLDPQARIYLQRAQEGTQRLSLTLTAMSEATRVEEAIRSAEPEPVPLASLLMDMAEAYRSLHGQVHIRAAVASSDRTVAVVPDLIVQMLDKLIDNAVSFCPDGGEIILAYEERPDAVVITVENDGPLLPGTMREQLFDNMVSLRDKAGDVHLGLGLHIVRLIVECHRGQISAANRSDGSGVVFRVMLPQQ